MELSDPSLKALREVITGKQKSDNPIAPYRSGPDLVDYFNQFGNDHTYGSGFPSRRMYAKTQLDKFNGTPIMKEICEAAVDPRHFWGSHSNCKEAVDYLNKFLEFDDLRLEKVGGRYQVLETQGTAIDIGNLFVAQEGINHRFIQEQLAKCDRKLREGDYTGAITNARSLVEAVLREVENALDPNPCRYDGNLSKLYKRVYRRMNLDPGQEGLSNAAREILSGIISAISGLAPIRNAASDAHALEYRPAKHHAELAVNAAKTVTQFVKDSLEYQLEKNLIELQPISEESG